jgi:hypothetical protein
MTCPRQPRRSAAIVSELRSSWPATNLLQCYRNRTTQIGIEQHLTRQRVIICCRGKLLADRERSACAGLRVRSRASILACNVTGHCETNHRQPPSQPWRVSRSNSNPSAPRHSAAMTSDFLVHTYPDLETMSTATPSCPWHQQMPGVPRFQLATQHHARRHRSHHCPALPCSSSTQQTPASSDNIVNPTATGERKHLGANLLFEKIAPCIFGESTEEVK